MKVALENFHVYIEFKDLVIAFIVGIVVGVLL